MHSHGKGGRPRPSLNALSGFASAKASTYDKQARKRKERALNSKVVNKYRKLKARLQASGGAVPHLDAALQTGSEQSEERQLSLPGQQETAQPPQHQQQQQQAQSAGSKLADKRPKHGRKPKPASQLQRIAQEKEAEQEEQRRQKEEQRLAAEKRREEVAQARQRRKQQTTQFRKRTRTGQPVMKYRIGKVLEKLQVGKA